MEKIIITFGTRPLAQRLSNLLQDTYEVLFATSEDLPSFLGSRYGKIPTGLNPTFAHELLKLGLDQEANYILPLGLAEIQTLSDSKILFEEYGIQVLCPDRNDLETLFVLENPNAQLGMHLLNKGESLLGEPIPETVLTGLFAADDDGDSVALITV